MEQPARRRAGDRRRGAAPQRLDVKIDAPAIPHIQPNARRGTHLDYFSQFSVYSDDPSRSLTVIHEHFRVAGLIGFHGATPWLSQILHC
jgi:hypothetical protein